MLRLPSAPPVLLGLLKAVDDSSWTVDLEKTLNQPTLFKNRLRTHLEKTPVMLSRERTQTYVGEHCLIFPLCLHRSEVCNSTPDYTDQEDTDCLCSTEDTWSLFLLQIQGQLFRKLSSKISFKISFPWPAILLYLLGCRKSSLQKILKRNTENSKLKKNEKPYKGTAKNWRKSNSSPKCRFLNIEKWLNVEYPKNLNVAVWIGH